MHRQSSLERRVHARFGEQADALKCLESLQQEVGLEIGIPIVLFTSVRLPNSESASSNNRMACVASAASKRPARFFSVSPMYFETIFEMST